MPKDENNNGVSSNNGSGPSAGGVTPNVFIDEADRLEVEAQHARFREVRKELQAQGLDWSAEYEKVLAKAATWSSVPS